MQKKISEIINFVEGEKKIFLKFYVTNSGLIPETDDIKSLPRYNIKKIKEKNIREAKKNDLKIRKRGTENNVDTYLQLYDFKNIDCKMLWNALLKEYDIVEDVVQFVLRKQDKKNKHVLGINLRRKTRGTFDYDDEEEDEFFDKILTKTSCSKKTIEKIEEKIIEKVIWENVRCFCNLNNTTINCTGVNYKF